MRITTAFIAIIVSMGSACAQSGYDADTFRRYFENLTSLKLRDSLLSQLPAVIVMDGEAIVRVRPDAVEVRVGSTSQASAASAALSENAKQMSVVMEALKDTIGAAALESGAAELRTETIHFAPVYARSRDGSEASRIEAYRATNAVTVTIRDFGERDPGFIGLLIERATQGGANEITGPHFKVQKEAEPIREARVNAVNDARTRAETYANALGIRLGRILSVSEVGQNPRTVPMTARNATAEIAGSPPVEAGTNEIRSHVTVVWEVRQE